MNKKVILMILDGWGFAPDKTVSAVDQAHTPFIDSLYTKYPHAQLLASGENVGLPEGQMGNSEVGHMNLGAGRIVYQNLAMINKAVREDTLKDTEAISTAFAYAKEKKKAVHIMGLFSDGGVHSHIDHAKNLIKAADEAGIDEIFIQAFTDGRDVDPQSGKGFITDIDAFAKEHHAKLASVTGRYYAMDRDNRWDRVKLAYAATVLGEGEKSHDIAASIQKSYDEGITDEFIKPIIMMDDKEPVGTIQQGDVVIYFNFRTDRGRELTQMLTQKDFSDQNTRKLDLHFVTMTSYDQNYKNIEVVYNSKNLVDTLGEVLAKAGKKQIRIAETEKYPHVTFFFSGGREEPFVGEDRLLCPSPKVATYDLQPEMSAGKIQEMIIPELEKEEVDFICLNFANPDMVGHTGDMDAAIIACETVDGCAREVITTALAHGYSTIVIADHGNCETMKNADGSPNTSHTTNPVPLILVDNDIKEIKNGILSDIAPTILKMLNVEKPAVMDRESLV